MSLPRLHQRLARSPRATLVALLLATVVLGSAAPFTGWDADPERLTLDGSPELRAYRTYLERFGSDELIVVAFEDPALLTPEGLGRVRALTDAFYEIPEVESVASLDTAYRVDVGPFGPFALPLLPEDLSAAPSAETLIESVQALAMTRDTLLDPSGTTTVIVVTPRATTLGRDARSAGRRVLDGIEELLADSDFAGTEFHLAGSPVFHRELERGNVHDHAWFTPITLLLVTVLLAISLRSLIGVGLALACVGGTLAWVRGVMTFLDIPFDTTTSLLSPLLMVLSVSVAVHILSRYQSERAKRKDPLQAVTAVERAVLRPAALTAFTTAIGFASLTVSRIPSIRSFGALAALGVGVAFLLGAIGLPAALRCLRPRSGAPRSGAVDRALGVLRDLGDGNGRGVIAVSALLVLLSIPAIGALRVSTHDADFFASDHPLNRAYRFIESRLAGVTPLEISVEARRPGAIRMPESLAAIRRVQDFLAKQPETVAGVSIADWVDVARGAIDGPAESSLPLDAEGLERAAFVLEAVAGEDLPYWVKDDWSLARISSRSIALDSAGMADLLERVEEFLASAERGAPVRFEATGLVPVFARMEAYLLESQIRSFALALGAIFVVFLVLFRSVRVALLALAPNLLAIAVALGVMGALGIPLDIVTVMVASVNLGIVVDDTIHLLHGLRSGLEKGLPVAEAMDRALATVGRAVVFTSFVLVLGFSVLTLSEFRPTARFGGLTALTLVLALGADLVLLPALVRRFQPFVHRAHSLALREVA